jgi:hypothetical protein
MGRRLHAFGALALLAACGEGGPPPVANQAVPPPPAAAPAEAANETEPEPAPTPAMPSEPPDDYPGVAELSPSQRRAYERGWRDCRDGRYAPGEWAEAYRIGCAAAQDGR